MESLEEPEDQYVSCEGESSAYGQETTSVTSQQYGLLNKIGTMTILAAMPMWMEEIPQHPALR